MKAPWSSNRRIGSAAGRIWAICAILVLATIPVAIHAQAYYGSIVGNVTDTTGAVIVGAKVVVTNTATDVSFNTVTSSIGAYALAQLPVGTYTVTITAPNFKVFKVDDAEVHVSTDTTINGTLSPGATSQTVTVEASAIQVETASASVGEVITGEQTRELPLNGENFIGLTQLSPGVSPAASFDGEDKGLEGGVNFSVNGNPYTNNLFLVDGVNNNDVGSNRTILVYPSTEAIAEFKMIRNSFGAEYGQASGAIISITTKSGSNQIHGGFFYAGRNSALDANNFFNNELGVGKAKLRRNDYGYYGAGPVWKDHVFVWWNQEWNKEIRGSAFGACVPTAAESVGDFSGYGADGNNGHDQCGAAIPGTTTLNSDGTTTVNPGFPSWLGTPNKLTAVDPAGALLAQFYPTPNVGSNGTSLNASGFNWAAPINNPLNWSEWNVRPDWDINKSNRATFRWTQDSWTNPSPNVGDSFWGESDFPTVQSSWSQPSKSVMAKLSSTITPSMINDVEFGYGHNAIITTLGGSKASIVPALQQMYPATFPASLKEAGAFFGNWGGFNPYGSYEGEASFWNIAPYKNHEDLYTVQDNLSKVRGNHTLKAGFFYGNNIKVEDSGNGQDRPSFPGGAPYCAVGQKAPPATPTAGIPACVQTNNSLANVLVPGTGASPQVFTNITENSTDITAQVKWYDYEWYLSDAVKVNKNITAELGFRWSFYREPFSADNQWSNWSLANWSASDAASNPTDACNGLIVQPGTQPCQAANKLFASLGVPFNLSSGTPGTSRALIPNNNHDIAPRVGIAWDIFGNGKTALRAGGGQFYQRELVGQDEGMEKGDPFSLSASSNRPLDSATSWVCAATGCTTAPGFAGGSVSPNFARIPRAVTPNSWQWNVTIEQELHRNTSMQIGYVGNTGEHLTSMLQFNPIPQSEWSAAVFSASGTGTNPYRPAYNFGQINGFGRDGHATYHSLQALFRSQVGASTFQAAYTWGHSIGDVEEDNSSGSANQEIQTYGGNSRLDKGNTNINRPDIFVANEVYYLPKFAGSNNFVKQTVGGWEFNGIIDAVHASSLTIFANGSYTDAANQAPISQLIGTGYVGNNRPLVTGQKFNAGEKTNHVGNAGAFTLVGYPLGTIPANIEHRGFGYGAPTEDWDSQLAKNWMVKEKYRIKFAMDFFDFLNHPNFNSGGMEGEGYTPSVIGCGGAPCSPTNNVVTSQSSGVNLGQPTSLQTAKGNRELQYSLHFSF
jgi:hypothetical protein